MVVELDVAVVASLFAPMAHKFLGVLKLTVTHLFVKCAVIVDIIA